MDRATREQVRERAGHRCEFCRLREQDIPFDPFQVEHIIPKQHRGTSYLDNLAWSCSRCNLHKGPNLSGIDPETNQVVRLFNPRRQRWTRHFAFDGPLLVGRTRCGRATVEVFAMNARRRVVLRLQLLTRGESL